MEGLSTEWWLVELDSGGHVHYICGALSKASQVLGVQPLISCRLCWRMVVRAGDFMVHSYVSLYAILSNSAVQRARYILCGCLRETYLCAFWFSILRSSVMYLLPRHLDCLSPQWVMLVKYATQGIGA